MIITILDQIGFSRSAGLASQLAMLRAQAGRNVLLVYTNSSASSRGVDHPWEVVEIKLGAVAHTVVDKNIASTLRNLAPRYNDIVISAGTCDSPGNQSTLMATNIAIVPIQPCNSGVKMGHQLSKRIEAARVGNPSLRVLFLIMGAPENLSIRDIETARTFVATIRSAVLVNTPVCDVTATQAMSWENFREPLNRTWGNAAMSQFYRTVFVAD